MFLFQIPATLQSFANYGDYVTDKNYNWKTTLRKTKAIQQQRVRKVVKTARSLNGLPFTKC
jgi:hypothetical protein